MAGGSVDKPWREFEARTIFVPVALDDWLLVKQGHKTEFREPEATAVRLGKEKTPCPVVAYTQRRVQGFESAMLMLEQTWKEPVSAISEESLEREGYPDMAHFRRYWMRRTDRRFRPLEIVHVYQVRPLHPDEYPTAGLQLLDKLYGEHLDVR